MTQDPSKGARAGAERYTAFLRAAHSPAHARRTAQANASFFLPLLTPGMRLLDAGCGPGSITLGLADAVAPGLATGLDISSEALRSARALAGDRGCGNVEFIEGNVYELPFGDGIFDAVFSHTLLQHLEEPGVALREMLRVLRPGGVIGLADADYDGSLVWPMSPALGRALALQDAVRQRAGGDQRVGRKLGTLLAEAGAVDVVVSATGWCEGTRDATKRTAEISAAYLQAPAFVERVTSLGLASPAGLAEMAAAWRQWGTTPGAMWARFWCHAVGRKGV